MLGRSYVGVKIVEIKLLHIQWFETNGIETVLLVDVEKTFNSLKRQAQLTNMKYMDVVQSDYKKLDQMKVWHKATH